ncbi:alcohol oxidase [Mycena belliarum]|uniref:Alcohol oxidase n=1 Tax=Mycena belliarum TaxID=1033014 RepID=A0AAD6TPX2_9AGAR|nr:alcohol oxidase [Mycena belliae]
MWPFTNYPAHKAQDIGQLSDPIFDFIIVGGGTAGCCLASRLSEDPNVSVLLIERGPVSNDWQAHVPVLSANIYRPGAPAAIFPMSPLTHANDRVVQAVIGEGLGGGSLINGQIYTRGIADYNKWKDMGRTNWGYDALEPYFVKSENALSQPPSSFRGKDGLWLNQTFPTPFFETQRRVAEAAKKLGIPHISDINSPHAPAVCLATVDLTITPSAHRHSTFEAFLPLKVAQTRKNLTLCTDTLVTGLKFSADANSGAESLKAIGVYFEDTHLNNLSQRFCASASREVILCAGAIGTPQILMLSGVGPKNHLLDLKLAVVKDLPGVGSYLKDHIGIPVSYEVPMHESVNCLKNSIPRALVEVAKYLLYGGGLLSIPVVPSTIYLRSSLLGESMEITETTPRDVDARNPDNIPDIEVMYFAHRANEGEHSALDRVGVFSLLTVVAQPKSFGSVRLASPDPHARAQIDLGYFSNPDDWVVARKAVRFALRLGQEVRTQGHPFKDLVVPESDDNASIDEFIRQNLRTTYHYTSTCRMAPEDDPRPGVVDDELKVHGINGLRVSDCSIFPDILSAHPMAGAVVVAEKCADLIKKAHGIH